MPGNKKFNFMESGRPLKACEDDMSSEAASKALLSVVQSGRKEDESVLVRRLQDLLGGRDVKVDLDHLYQDRQVKGTLLHVAAKRNLAQVAQLLIDNGADLDARDLSGCRYCPLHYAAEHGHYDVMKVLLDEGANPNTTESGLRQTSLHLLLHTGEWRSRQEDFNNCLDALLDNKNINVKHQNNDKKTAHSLAEEQGWQYMAHNLSDFPYIHRHYNYELNNAMKKSKPDIEEFKNILTDMQTSPDKSMILDSEEDEGLNLLQYACDNGLTDFVKKLLEQNADFLKPDKTDSKSPIIYACEKGYYKAVNLLIDSMKDGNKLETGLHQVDNRKESALHKIVKQKHLSEESDYKRCLDLILNVISELDNPSQYIDIQDKFGNTPLHHAARQEDPSFVRCLLLNGAHLGIKNVFGSLAIKNIPASVLEVGFNDCVKLNNDYKEINDLRDLEVKLNYKMLVPTKDNQQPETDCIMFLSESYPHRYLLRHPIISTFLSLKWQKIKKYYQLNLIMYILYIISLTFHILIFHGSKSETSNLDTITADNSTVKDVTTIMDHDILKTVLTVLISLFTIYIVIKISIEILLSYSSFIRSFKSWLEIAIILMTFFLLYHDFKPVNQQHLSAWLVLFSWTNLILILGCHPRFAIYIIMFRRVSRNFIELIFLFSFMIIAFIFSFYLVFQGDDNFMTLSQTVMKTIAMSTGELEYTDLPMSSYPGTSHILFILFTLFILLVLMNLINGLAVSDINEIQKKAEINSYKNQAELISHLESVFLSESYKKSNPVLKFLRRVGSRTLLIFPNCLRRQNHCIKMFPNRTRGKKNVRQFMEGLIGWLPPVNWEICMCHNFDLDPSHVEATMAVVLPRMAGRERSLDY